ncbi:hypothetical protein LJE08_14300, partial [Holdemanella sp. DFI.5.55]|uniref:hypothetical protein n=1 Tax=Holdemanella sp. DFI.5.55 TaxID=2885263 RepID=UPI001D0B5705
CADQPTAISVKNGRLIFGGGLLNHHAAKCSTGSTIHKNLNKIFEKNSLPTFSKKAMHSR